MRIVSLVPSLTHLLFDLGLNHKLVGRTKFCIHPKDQVKGIPIIGGTKNVHIQKVLDLKPTWVIASKEENLKNQVEDLQRKVEVLVTDIQNLKDNLSIIELIGKKTNTIDEAHKIQQKVKEEFSFLKEFKKQPNVLYLIWKDPYMSVGRDTFIHDLLSKAGFKNIFKSEKRYPIVNFKNLAIQPDYVFLSSEPYPFSQKHVQEIQKDFPSSKVVLVDGELFSWYGSFIQKSPQYFIQLREYLGLT